MEANFERMDYSNYFWGFSYCLLITVLITICLKAIVFLIPTLGINPKVLFLLKSFNLTNKYFFQKRICNIINVISLIYLILLIMKQIIMSNYFLTSLKSKIFSNLNILTPNKKLKLNILVFFIKLLIGGSQICLKVKMA